MQNINEQLKIKGINLDALVGEVENNGTFKEILDAVLNKTLVPIVNSRGQIIGGSYNMPATDLVEDNVNKIRFERKYSGKPLMSWFMSALDIAVNPKVEVYGIKEVIEDENVIKVVLNNDEEITVYESYRYNTHNDEDLPCVIDLEDLDIDEDTATVRDIRRAVKNEYGYFLAKDYDVEAHLDCGILYDVRWGRKASESELD